MPRLADSILNVLERRHVDTVFGIPGNHNVELYRYLPEHDIRHVTARHEQGAGFMADGYARATGRPGVCFLISGPGVTNALTAMAQALADSVPMLVIATVGDQLKPQGRLHELPDQLQVAGGVCLEAVQAETPEAALAWIDHALVAHEQARPGPRYIQIPLSWWQQQADLPEVTDTPANSPAQRDLDRACDLLEEAVRPLLLIGGGTQNAADEVLEFASLLGAPVINTVNAKGVMNPNHPLALGGSPSLQSVRSLIETADLIVAVGTELGETDYDLLMIGDLSWQTPVLRIDIDSTQAAMNVVPAAIVVGDAAQVLKLLHDSLAGIPRECWVDLTQVRKEIGQHPHMHPQFAELFDTIDRVCPEAVVVGDSTRPTYYATWMWERHAPRRYWHSVSGYGTLGYALPAAIGALIGMQSAAARSSAARSAVLVNTPQTIAMIGDGGLLFTLAELAVAVHEQLPVKVLLWDNAGYQEIAHSMTARGIDASATQYQAPDFAAVAAGFGAVVSEPVSLQELAAALALDTSGPHVIHLQEHRFITEPSGEWY